MKPDELREIIDIIEKAKIDVLKLEKNDFKLYYQKNGAQGIQIDEDTNSEEATLEEIETANEQTTPPAQSDDVKENDEDNLHQITSPIVGAFYARPKPESDPYVQIGSKIKQGDTVCVLEAMKLLNEVKSDVDGEIVDILVKDEEIIEFGQPLFTVKLSE